MSARIATPVRIAPDHPAFPGHFPGRPVVPAVVLLAEVLAAVEQATQLGADGWTLVNAKFLAPVGPGTEVVVVHEPAAAGGRRFEVLAGGQVVASGALARK